MPRRSRTASLDRIGSLKDERLSRRWRRSRREGAAPLDELQRRQRRHLQTTRTRRRRRDAAAAASTVDPVDAGAVSGVSAAAGSVAGGRTGGCGGGTNPRGSGIGYIDAIICPDRRTFGIRRHVGSSTQRRPASPRCRHARPDRTELQAVGVGFVEHTPTLSAVSLVADRRQRQPLHYAHLWGTRCAGRVEQTQGHRLHRRQRERDGVRTSTSRSPEHCVPREPTPSVRLAVC